MRPGLKIEKLPLVDECEDMGTLKETELSQLSFWNEPQQNFLPDWHQVQNRLTNFKIAGIACGGIIFLLFGYFVFRIFSTPSLPSSYIQPQIKVLPAPALPHKIKVQHENNTQDHAVYHRHETTIQEPTVLNDDTEEEVELTTIHEEDLPYTAPTKTSGTSSKKTRSLAVAPTNQVCAKEGSYYIEIGLFDSHQLALDTWCNLKKDPSKTKALHEVEPMIEIINGQKGEQYRLLAGPIPYKEGRLKTQILNSKGYNMKLVGRNN